MVWGKGCEGKSRSPIRTCQFQGVSEPLKWRIKWVVRSVGLGLREEVRVLL